MKRFGAAPSSRAEQVPVATKGDVSPVSVAGIEIWNEGRQATQIRDIRIEWEGGGAPLELRFIRHRRPELPSALAEEDFQPIGRVLESGEMWQVRMTYANGDAILSLHKPKLVIVPVLGEACKVVLKDPTWLDGPWGGPRF